MKWMDLSREYRDQSAAYERAFRDVMQNGCYVSGTAVRELEETLAAYAGVTEAVATGSGTDALWVGLKALEIGPGDEVITSPFTYVATAEAIVRAGARPVWCDIHPQTYNLDPRRLEAAITPRTKAILPVSLFGLCADFTAINAIAAKRRIPVLEDGCQSFGARHAGRRSGSLSTLGATSFYPTKPLGGFGDGGMIFTADSALAEACRRLRNHGWEEAGKERTAREGAEKANANGENAGTVRHTVRRLGANSRLDTLQAALLLVKWPGFENSLELRRRWACRYLDRLGGASDLTLPLPEFFEDHVFAQFTLATPHRDSLRRHLQALGIPTAVYYPTPLHRLPVFAHTLRDPLPCAEKASREVLSLPLYPHLREDEVDRVCRAVKAFFNTRL